MFLFIFGLFVGCSLGVFLISMLVKSKEADRAFNVVLLSSLYNGQMPSFPRKRESRYQRLDSGSSPE